MKALQAVISGRIGKLPIDVQIDTGEGTLVIVGPNGAGKTALLLMILGIRQPDSGRVAVGETTLFDAVAGVDIAVEERRLGYVPQDYALFPHMTVLENVEFAAASSDLGSQRKSHRLRAEAMLSDLGLTELAERRTSDLSGGEKQKVALARALAAKPQALLLDEPLSALDAASRRDVRLFLAAYLRRLDLPAIVVTHDPADAKALGDRFVVIDAGRTVQFGTWEELRERPASAFIEEFVTG
jgi:molybdate transport system ATP-binding protein